MTADRERRHPRGPLPAFLRPLTLPVSRLYAAAVAGRNRGYDRGIGVRRVDRPVISIGNLTTGGTGKTPMVMWIARTLLDAGRHPVIAMRGYRARPGQRSDEELEYHDALPQVPVLAQPDRTAALRAFLPRHPQIDCVLLDDGFQHRQLHRDLDLVLIDAQAGTLRDQLLPAGHLREPPDALQRADGVIVTHAMQVDDGLAQEIVRWHGRAPLAWTSHSWTALWLHRPDERAEATPVEWLMGKRVLTLLGVGNPKAVMAQLEQAGAKIMANIPAGDHEHYDLAKLSVARGLCSGVDAMVVTRKDWVKIGPLLAKGKLGRWPTPIVAPQLEMEFLHGENVLRRIVLETAVGEPVTPSSRGGGGAGR